MEMKVTDQTEVTIKLGVDFFSCALRLVGFALVRILTRWKIGGFVGANLFAEVEAEVRSNSAAPRGMN